MQAKLLPVLAAGLMVAGAAFASQTSGTIASVNLKANSVTLTNGTTYYLPAQFRLDGFRAGERVSLDWAMKGGMHDATSMRGA